MLLYLVNTKHTQTGKGVRMNFATWYDMDGAWVDTVHFPDAAASFPFNGPGCYVVKGKVMNDFGFITIDVNYMERPATRNMETANARLKPGVESIPEERRLE